MLFPKYERVNSYIIILQVERHADVKIAAKKQLMGQIDFTNYDTFVIFSARENETFPNFNVRIFKNLSWFVFSPEKKVQHFLHDFPQLGEGSDPPFIFDPLLGVLPPF